MKLRIPKHCIIIVTGLAFAWTIPTLRADLEVNASVSIHSEADFYQPLATHGAWVEVDTYGRCWRPARVAVEWQPYCEGHWVWTDCGWYWESDEPWGWACYHYGRWHYHPVHHWIWIPGREWAPAWVSWRVGGAYIGWAPLPPTSVVVAGPTFVFVQSSRFHEPVRRSSVIVNNTTIINQTKVINNVRTETRTIAGAGPQKVYVNEGPGLDAVQKATKQTIKPLPIQEVARKSAPAEFVRKQAPQQSNPSAGPVSKGGRPPGKGHDHDRGGQERGKGKPDA